MKTQSHLVTVILLSTCLLGPRVRAASHYAERELLVKWKDGPNSYAAAAGNAQIGSTVKRNFNTLGWQHVQLPEGPSVRAGIEAYQALATVLAVEPNGVIVSEPPPPVSPTVPSAPGEGDDTSASNGAVRTPRSTVGLHALTTGLIPNDPLFSKQWYLKKIGATNAWATTTGSTNVVVAIFDTGVDYQHEDLMANMWRNPGETGLDANGNDKATNGIDDDGNGYVDDVHGIDVVSGTGDPIDVGFWDSTEPAQGKEWHGTYIAGLIGAVGNNRIGIAGVNWAIQIMAIRAYGGDLSKQPPPNWWSGYLAAWDYVISMRRRGVNIRVANHSYAVGFSHALRDAWAAAGEEGILSVCGAGNSKADHDLWFWGLPNALNLPSIISVAASTETDSLADFSNFGRSTVHLAAPGVNMSSTWFGSEYLPPGGWGSSWSAPLVVGAAALLWSAHPALTLREVKTALLASVDQRSALKGRVVTNGRLNVSRALQYLTNTTAPPIIVFAAPAGQRTQTNDPLQVTFSRPMDRASVESALSISPIMGGTFEWSEDSTSFTFHFQAPLNSATNYIARVSGTAHDQTGTTLDGNFDGTGQGSPADEYMWTFRFTIPNDDFANAELLAGSSGSVRSSNRYASLELDEPFHVNGDFRKIGSSLWYRWTSPASGGWFTFDLTSGNNFDSLLAIYTGDRLAGLVARAGNDNFGTRQSSRLSLEALPETSYAVVVASKDALDQTQAGNFILSWYPTPPPSFNSSQFSQQSGVPGAKITLSGTNFTGATSVLFNAASASFTNAASTNLDLRITAIVPPDATSGPITIVTPHGNVTSTASFQVLPPPLSVKFSAANGLQITWPATSSAFVLEASEDLSSGSWRPVAQAPDVANGQSKITLAAPIGNRFFRLRKN